MIKKRTKSNNKVFLNDLKSLDVLGFKNGSLETKGHYVTYFYYDIGRLIIQGKVRYARDEVYIEDYFEVKRFMDLIALITGHVFTPQQYNIAKTNKTT